MREGALRWTRWLLASAAVLAADLATKAWASRAFRLHESVEVTPFLNLVLVHNTGAAFSFLAGAGGWQRWFFVGVTVAVSAALLAMLRRHHANRVLSTGVSLVLGGAAGNLWDRLTLGHVVDFVQLHAGGYHWPAFNVADSAITVGVALLVWDGFRPTADGAAAAPAGPEKP